jgi:hypothetical protein
MMRYASTLLIVASIVVVCRVLVYLTKFFNCLVCFVLNGTMIYESLFSEKKCGANDPNMF